MGMCGTKDRVTEHSNSVIKSHNELQKQKSKVHARKCHITISIQKVYNDTNYTLHL